MRNFKKFIIASNILVRGGIQGLSIYNYLFKSLKTESYYYNIGILIELVVFNYIIFRIIKMAAQLSQ